MSISVSRVVAAAILLVAAAAAVAATGHASAQACPDRPATIVVPYPPGGSTDVMARLMQNKMSEVLGQPKRRPEDPGPRGEPAPQVDAGCAAVGESIPIVDGVRWIGFFAPAGTPDEAIARLKEAAVAALKECDVVEKIEALRLDGIAGSASDLEIGINP